MGMLFVVACNSLMILFISRVSVVTSFSFISSSVWAPFLFSLMSLARGLWALFIFWKNHFQFHRVFLYHFLPFCFIYFCPDLSGFFPSAPLSFACSFSSPFSITSGFLRSVIFLPSWGDTVSLQVFLWVLLVLSLVLEVWCQALSGLWFSSLPEVRLYCCRFSS